MRQITSKVLLLVLSCATLGACSTPASVNDLAGRTAANVTQVGTHLQNLSKTTESVAAARARNVANLKATVRDVQKRHALDIALIEKTGDRNSLTNKDDILAWMIKARATARGMTVTEFQSVTDHTVDQYSSDVKEITDSLETLDTRTAALNQVAKNLAALSQKDDPEARARYLVGYVKEVRKGIKENQEAAEQAATASISASESATTSDSPAASP